MCIGSHAEQSFAEHPFESALSMAVALPLHPCDKCSPWLRVAHRPTFGKGNGNIFRVTASRAILGPEVLGPRQGRNDLTDETGIGRTVGVNDLDLVEAQSLLQAGAENMPDFICLSHGLEELWRPSSRPHRRIVFRLLGGTTHRHRRVGLQILNPDSLGAAKRLQQVIFKL